MNACVIYIVSLQSAGCNQVTATAVFMQPQLMHGGELSAGWDRETVCAHSIEQTENSLHNLISDVNEQQKTFFSTTIFLLLNKHRYQYMKLVQ